MYIKVVCGLFTVHFLSAVCLLVVFVVMMFVRICSLSVCLGFFFGF